MEEDDLDSSAGDCSDSAIYLHWRRNRDALVELAAAVALWLARDHLLAGAWTSRAVPHPLRQARRTQFHSLRCPPAHGRALRQHDSRGARTIPSAHARTLRLQ